MCLLLLNIPLYLVFSGNVNTPRPCAIANSVVGFASLDFTSPVYTVPSAQVISPLPDGLSFTQSPEYLELFS